MPASLALRPDPPREAAGQHGRIFFSFLAPRRHTLGRTLSEADGDCRMEFDELEWVRERIDLWLQRHGLTLALAAAAALALASLFANS